MENSKNEHIVEKTIRLLAVDPIHVGIGRDRIGRVDMPIVRTPETGIPKIPGTAINGACRHFADLRLRMAGKRSTSAGQKFKAEEEEINGKTVKLKQSQCPVCLTFGYTDEEESSQEGFLSIKDAHIMLFPVRTCLGTTWVTTPDRLKKFIPGIEIKPDNLPFSFLRPDGGSLDIGWYLMQANKVPTNLSVSLNKLYFNDLPARKLTVVDEKSFSFVVNDNLEVRTGIAINPDTGTVEEGALFRFEAIPRGTYLAFEVALKPNWTERFSKAFTELTPALWFKMDTDLITQWSDKTKYTPWSVFALAEEGLLKLGLGGMTTRGFGRLSWDFQK